MSDKLETNLIGGFIGELSRTRHGSSAANSTLFFLPPLELLVSDTLGSKTRLSLVKLLYVRYHEVEEPNMSGIRMT
jgi:hypothetical protein